MTRRRFRIERGGPRRLELRWRRGLRDFSVTFDGVTTPLPRSAVEEGVSVSLPDGSALWLQMVRRRWWSTDGRDRMRVERNGAPVPGSDFHPGVIGRRAAGLMVLVGLGEILLAFLLASFSPRVPPPLLLLEGVLLWTCALPAAFGLRVPVIAAAALLALDAIVPFALGNLPNPFGVLVRALVALHLVVQWRRMKPVPRTEKIAAVFE